jgi:arylsulfatase A-like enzyme
VIKSNGYGYSSEDIEDVRRGYEAACEYQADEIINLIKRLKEQGLYHPDRDIFVFTADHGECLSCEKYEMMGHVPPALWEEIIRVPLVISMPNWNQKKIHEQVSLVNVYNIIKTAVKARIDEDSSLDAPSPEQLTTDVAHFATEWEVPGENTIRRYRGVRTAEGAKLFGRRNDEDDTVVLTQYDKSSMLDEVQFESNKDSTPTDDDTAVLWRELINMVEERGPILGDVQAVNKKVNRKHLRDLGYIQ